MGNYNIKKPKDNTQEMKIGIFGDKQSGKTSLLKKFYNNSFKTKTISTESPKQYYKYYKVGGQGIMLHMWDTPSIAQYPLIEQYAYGLDGIVLTFDLTSKISFEVAKSFLYMIQKEKNKSLFLTKNIIIAGCKGDLKTKREVCNKEASDFAYNNNICYIATSVLNGSGVRECFEYIITLIYNDSILAKKKK